MRFIIDTDLERVIVNDGFFKEIDKRNKILAENGAEDKKIDYEVFIKENIEKALKNAPIRKSDIKAYKNV